MLKTVSLMGVACPPLYGENESFYVNESIKAMKAYKKSLKKGDIEGAMTAIKYADKCNGFLLELLYKDGN